MGDREGSCDKVAWANKTCREIQRLKAVNAALLKACKAVLESMPHEGLDCSEEVEAAIAKAEEKPC
jgi:hypothetical protein